MSHSSSPDIAAVIVTYKRPAMLVDLVESLLAQTQPLSAIYIVDNNDEGRDTRKLLANRGWLSTAGGDADGEVYEQREIGSASAKTTVYYRGIYRNVGCSEGFCEGIGAALGRSHDWLWLMDDDIRPEPACLAALVAAAVEHPGTVGLGCARFYEDGELVTFDAKRINTRHLAPFITGRITADDLKASSFPIQTVPFEGMLVSEAAVREIGLPDRRFFILGDDTDYCLRLLKIGGLRYVSGARLIRRIKPVMTLDPASWKAYYTIRNLVYLDLRHALPPLALLRVAIGALLNLRHYAPSAAGRAAYLRAYRDAFRMRREPVPYSKMTKI